MFVTVVRLLMWKTWRWWRFYPESSECIALFTHLRFTVYVVCKESLKDIGYFYTISFKIHLIYTHIFNTYSSNLHPEINHCNKPEGTFSLIVWWLQHADSTGAFLDSISLSDKWWQGRWEIESLFLLLRMPLKCLQLFKSTSDEQLKQATSQ